MTYFSKLLICFLCILTMFCSCEKEIVLNFENQTIYDSVNVVVYRNHGYFTSLWIKHDHCFDCFTPLVMPIGGTDTTIFTFVNKTLQMSDSCRVLRKELSNKCWMLISSSDHVFRKGTSWGSEVIKKDSIRRIFFCNFVCP